LARRTRTPFFPGILTVATLVPVVAVLAPSAAHASDAGAFVSDADAARSANGVAAFIVSSDLVAIAERHAAWMAAHRSPDHNSALASDVCCWKAVGENVGAGSSEKAIEHAFMGSAPHRDNIMSATFTEIGVGTARDSSGMLYVDEVFRDPTGHVPAATKHPRSRHRHQRHQRAAAASTPAAPRSAARAPVAPQVEPSATPTRPPLAPILRHLAGRQHHVADPVAAAYRFTTALARLPSR
jgi:Cysteine-rich secretory protein family